MRRNSAFVIVSFMSIFILCASSEARFIKPNIAAGDSYSLALTSSGGVWSWGSNHRGQLGDGTTQDSFFPIRVLCPIGSGHLILAIPNLTPIYQLLLSD
jgi:hypothetical protein